MFLRSVRGDTQLADGIGRGRSQIIRRRESLVFYKYIKYSLLLSEIVRSVEGRKIAAGLKHIVYFTLKKN
jgi:hypothetical protein